MRKSTPAKLAKRSFLFAITFVSIVSMSFGSQSSDKTWPTQGVVSDWPNVDLEIDTDQIIGTNQLSLGFQLDWERFHHFINRPEYKQLALDANLKLIRVFDFRRISNYGYDNLMPCNHWPDSWDWTTVDALANAVFSVGAEPLFCLGWARSPINNYIPPGMPVDPDTGLPYPDTYAAYAKEWVKHFKSTGLPVRFYQIMNEPYFYFGWSQSSKLGHFVNLWNAAAREMRTENPDILLSQDAMTMKFVLNYWIEHGEDVDYLDFHKYDADNIGQYSDSEMLRRAETLRFETYGSFYGIDQARQTWFDARGKWLPVINSESNFNCAWNGGTDPKIQQMTGAVWLALVLRMGILKGLTYNVYFEFSNSKSWSENNGPGWGFGMINQDDNQPWYPYYVHKMVGSNLEVGDELVKADSSSNDIRSIVWIHQGKLNILLICKVDEPRTVTLQGVNGQLDVSWIDNAIPYESPSIQTDIIGSDEPLVMNGYTVALLQKLGSP